MTLRVDGSAMRALPRILALSLLGATFGVAAPACKKSGPDTEQPAPKKPKRKAGMPKPYKLPAKPAMAVHVEMPEDAGDTAAAYTGGAVRRPGPLMRIALAGKGNATDLDKKLVSALDKRRPWSAAVVQGQTILWVPVRADKAGAVKSMLSNKPPVGKFGAVDLQRSGAGAKLAWYDKDTNYIAFADDERGLATARVLPSEYGTSSIYLSINAAQAKRFSDYVPFDRIEVRGKGPHDFKLTTEGLKTDGVARLDDISNGALTGMLESKQIAVGVSTRLEDHEAYVNKVMSRAKSEVNKAPSIAKGNLEGLRRRLGAALRSWNGRTMVGVGPSRHVLLGFGADDVGKMGGATHQLMQGVRDNVATARMFIKSVPKVRWAGKKREAAGVNIAVVALESAKKHIPSEYHELLNSRGELRIAMAFPKRAGGGMFVIGPDSEDVLATWLEQTKGATKGEDSKGHFVAATFAVSPSKLASLDPGSISSVLGLSAQAKPTKVVVRQKDGDYVVKVKGPKPATASPSRTAAP